MSITTTTSRKTQRCPAPKTGEACVSEHIQLDASHVASLPQKRRLSLPSAVCMLFACTPPTRDRISRFLAANRIWQYPTLVVCQAPEMQPFLLYSINQEALSPTSWLALRATTGQACFLQLRETLQDVPALSEDS